MDENNTTDTVNETQKPENIKRKKRRILCPLLVVLALLLGAGAYYWRDSEAKKQKNADKDTITKLEKEKGDLQKQLSESNKKTEVVDCTSALPTASVKENLIASITSKNTAAIASYSAPSVKVVIAASEASFTRTPNEAVKDIDYVLSAQEPWNFAIDKVTLDNYAAGPYKEYFKTNSVVGVSKDKKVIVFNFNCTGNGKVDSVFMAASSDLLTE